MKFKRYKLIIYSKIVGLRIIKREMTDREYNHIRGSVLDRNVYIVQKHRKLLGIGYWRTLIRTTSWQVAKNIYYYLS